MNPPPPLHNLRLSLQYLPIDGVAPNLRDPRRYNRAEVRRIASFLRRMGVMPLVVTAERVLLSGNIWLEAARLAGFIDVPVIVADHLSAAEADAFMLAQVKLVERGSWDEKALGEVLRDLTLQDLDFDVTITGFDAPEIDFKNRLTGRRRGRVGGYRDAAGRGCSHRSRRRLAPGRPPPPLR